MEDFDVKEKLNESAKSPSPLNEVQVDLRYGWGRFRPRILQTINGPKCFILFLALFSMTQGLAVNGITSLNLPTLERRFQLTGKELGLIAASNDISALLLVAFVSFYGDYGNKIRWLGYGALVTGIGCFLFALPHLLIGPYRPVSNGQAIHSSARDLCLIGPNNTTGKEFCVSGYASPWYSLLVFIVAQMLMGGGTTPLYSLGAAYIDENVDPKWSPIYLGVWYGSTIFGPGLGYLVGGTFLQTFVDLKQPPGMNITPDDPRWVGAWWIGYVIGGFVLFASSFSLLGFPQMLPGAKERRERAIKEGSLPKRDENLKGNLKDIIPATKLLLTNKTFMFNTLGITAGSIFGGGLATFLAKILQIKFSVSSSLSGIILGAVLIPGMATGILAGGFIIKRFKVKESCAKATKLCALFSCLTLLGGGAWFVPGCGHLDLAGVTVPYYNSTRVESVLTVPCNIDCACPKAEFNPVCGVDQVTYFSPCHAGCTSKDNAGGSYSNCSCIEVPRRVNGTQSTATNGFCGQESKSVCLNIIAFLAFILIILMTVFLSAIPNKTVVLRCVADNQRSYALGFQFIFLRSIGFLPGPLLLGSLFDQFCLLWGESCGERGSCMYYASSELSTRIGIFQFCITGFSFVFYLLSYKFYKPTLQQACEPLDKEEVKMGDVNWDSNENQPMCN